MTVQVIQMFAPTVLTAAATTLYTVAGSSTVLLARARMRFTNSSATAVTVTAYGVPSGGTAGAGNVFCDQKTLVAYGNLDIDVPVLPINATIQALASTASVVVAHALDGVLFS